MRRNHKYRIRRCRPRWRKGVWFKKFGKVAYVPCCYCHKLVTCKTSSLEHKLAISKGGSKKDLDNLEISCIPCNQDKSFFVERGVGRARIPRMSLETFLLLKRAKLNFNSLKLIYKFVEKNI